MYWDRPPINSGLATTIPGIRSRPFNPRTSLINRIAALEARVKALETELAKMAADVIPFRPKPAPPEPRWDADRVWAGEQTSPTYPDPPAAAPAAETPAL